jgi:hypothetical protein
VKFNPRRRAAQAGVAIIATAAASMFSASTASTAGAAGTNAGNATIVNPQTPRPRINAGGSQTTFSINLPQRAACSKDTASGQYHIFGYIVPSGTDPGGLQWDAQGPLLGRTDTATVTAKSPTVLDASIQSTDQGNSVAGTGLPSGYFVGTVTPGSSFQLSSSPTSQVNINATQNGSSVVIGPPNTPDNDTHTLYDTGGFPYVNVNTAINTGQIPVPVSDFNWNNYSLTGMVGGFQTLTLPAGTYNVGIACVTNTFTTDKFWNVLVTFSANSADPNGESWTVSLPDPPTHLVATPGNGSASVAFTPPAFGGASAVTGYTVTCTSSNGGATGSASGPGSPIVVTGLTNGDTYTCTGTASNVLGTSVASAPSNGFVEVVTSTAIASSGNPSTVGNPVTFTATVSPTPTGGTVSFTDTGSPIPGCQSVPLVGASATCTANIAGVGSHIIVASYSGTVGFTSSVSPSLGQVEMPCNMLRGCNLSGVNLSGASLSGADATGANLLNANLSGADLSNAILKGANLTGANLSNANLSGANLKGANLSNVAWSNTTCPDGTNSDGNGGTCIGHT